MVVLTEMGTQEEKHSFFVTIVKIMNSLGIIMWEAGAKLHPGGEDTQVCLEFRKERLSRHVCLGVLSM